MFSFFKKKPPAALAADPATAPTVEPGTAADDRPTVADAASASPRPRTALEWLNTDIGELFSRREPRPAPAAPAEPAARAAPAAPAAPALPAVPAVPDAPALPVPSPVETAPAPPSEVAPEPPGADETGAVPTPAPAPVSTPPAAPGAAPAVTSAAPGSAHRWQAPAPAMAEPLPEPPPPPPAGRDAWVARLRTGLRRTGSSLAQAFSTATIDEALYEDLEAALLQADAGAAATEHLLADLKARVRRAGARDPAAVRRLLADSIAELLAPLERSLVIGEHVPTVIMVAGVNGAGKTTTVGKLTRHLTESGQHVLLAAADTFRAAAREQLLAWAERADKADTGVPERAGGRGRVEIVSQESGDPSGVTFDAVVAAKARACDVVIADTAGRLATQVHLMDELKKIRRVIGKAQAGAPHEVLLVIDGNTGQNALTQVKAFDAALQLTGLVITKLDGTAKGGVLAAIALWSRSRSTPLPVYFVGVGEQLADLQTFQAREFAEALLS